MIVGDVFSLFCTQLRTMTEVCCSELFQGRFYRSLSETENALTLREINKHMND